MPFARRWLVGWDTILGHVPELTPVELQAEGEQWFGGTLPPGMTPEGHTACHGTFIFADPRQMSHACHRFWTCYKTLTFYHVLLTFDKVHNPLRNHI